MNGHVHSNGIENFWALLKRGLHGTYVSVEPVSHVPLTWMSGSSHTTPANSPTSGALVLRSVSSKRLTYTALTGRA